jgi:hypothetical protein
MLSPEEIFPLYSELALALAGFAGVVSAFSGRDRVFRPTERIRFVAVVMASACVLLGCFAIFAALAGEFGLSASYRVAGALCFAVSCTYAARTFPAVFRHAQDPDSSTERWSIFVSLGAYVSLCVCYAAAALTPMGFFSLVTGFSIHLLHGLWMFVRVLTRAN